MYVRCESSTYVVDNGVITVPMYQGNDITGCLNTVILYAIISNNLLQGYFVRLN